MFRQLVTPNHEICRFMSIAEIDAMIAKGEKFCPDELQIFEKFKMMIKEGKV